MSFPKSRMSRLRLLFLTPTAAVIGVLFLAPLGVVLVYSFLSRASMAASRALTHSELLAVDRSAVSQDPGAFLRDGGLGHGGVPAVGFPLALFISRAGSRKNLYLGLVMLPFWTSFWSAPMPGCSCCGHGPDQHGAPGRRCHPGAASAALQCGRGAGGLVYGYLPFAVLPLYATLERIDRTCWRPRPTLARSPGRRCSE